MTSLYRIKIDKVAKTFTPQVNSFGRVGETYWSDITCSFASREAAFKHIENYKKLLKKAIEDRIEYEYISSV